jgi:5-methylcytosine-specific restriction endonuclease McrA
MNQQADGYPDNWDEIARRIKRKAGFKCERCGHANDRNAGRVLTVHHLVPIKSLCEDWNLAALCQKCHLHIQAKVDMYQVYMFAHSTWFIPHLEGFMQWRKSENTLRR